MHASGSIFYQDEYGVVYRSVWSTTNGVLDVTTEISDPIIYGEQPVGYIQHNNVFRRGIVTTSRQLLRPTSTGYEIVASGEEQVVGDIQTTFNCATGPKDRFKHHYNKEPHEDCSVLITQGSRWVDIEDEGVEWADVAADGSIIDIVSSGVEVFDWVDIW